jgi:hypothetical protein
MSFFKQNAADLDVAFAAGTGLEISVAASRVPSELNDVETIFADDRLARKLTYAGTSDEPGMERLRVLLDELPETHLRMRIRFLNGIRRSLLKKPSSSSKMLDISLTTSSPTPISMTCSRA